MGGIKVGVRPRVCIAALVAAAGLIAAACAPTAPTTGTVTDADITVVQTPSGVDGPCVPRGSAISSGIVTHSREVTATAFTLTIEVAAPLCSPLDANAVIYRMPGGGIAWPQTLAATQPVHLLDAGTTVITFRRGCDPAQFDVVTGALPATIHLNTAPALLFFGRFDTAFQHWGGVDCESPTTTEAATTTTTEAATTTTTEAATTTTTEAATTTTIPTNPPGFGWGARTKGFWHNKNGQGIIEDEASTGTCPSATWLRQFAPFQDLASSSTCAQVAAYVLAIIDAADASGDSMNPMLKAQALATALDVYFSDAALGGNELESPSPIGNAIVDLRTVAKPIDSGNTEVVSAAFGGATCMSISAALTYASGQSNVGGSIWYEQVKATQELAKDLFDAINNNQISGC